MRFSIALVAFCSLTGCSSRDVAETAARPIAAPLAAQEQVLRELDAQKANARGRRELAERAVNSEK